MGRYREIVGGSWELRSVFAESVPHLFHHDMTYLWALEQQPDQRPKGWATRIEAWRVLMRLFFLDQLNPTQEDLRKPLLDVTERFGVRRITWLRNKQSGQPIGLLSPTVIVRPLPDFVDEDLDRWKTELKDNERDFKHLVQMAVHDLERVPSTTTPYAMRIADVLKREFEPRAATASQRPPGGRTIEVPLLNRLTWEKRDGDSPQMGSVTLSVRADSANEIPEYIPLCAACTQLLLQEQHAPAIDVGTPVFSIRCSNPQCPQPNQELSLDAFGIWLRNATTVVVWSPEHIPPMSDLLLPPAPSVGPNELQYEWNATTIGGERHRRFLRLRFSDRTVQIVPLMSIFFNRLLVPGHFSRFSGSPVLPEWHDALDRSTSAEVRPSDEQSQVEFRRIKVRGWPLTFSRFYKALSLQRAPELAVGLLPNPAIVGAAWKWYRAFVHVAGSGHYEVSCSEGRGVLPSFASTEQGVPQWVTVRASDDRTTGVSYLPHPSRAEDDYGGAVSASMAIDFGTTNTVAYWQPPQRQQQRRVVSRAETHGLDPRGFAQSALWLADNESWQAAEVIAAFLPGPAYRPTASDRFIVPSEVWRVGREGYHLIRWASDHPEGSEARHRQVVTQFKWDSDEGEEGLAPTRVAYLRELILQSLPTVIAAFDPARVVELKIGFAFPLAFEFAARAQFRAMLDGLGRELSHLTGLVVDISPSINESKACVNAFGSFNGETFLVADMGGGTLDLALFSYDSNGTMRSHQMGSLRYAGERCVEALASQLGGPEDTAVLREAIARGESARKFGKQSAERVVTQFTTIAFEFLRIMIAAYRAEKKERQAEQIRIVLIGNGWHLMEAFSTQVRVRGAKNVYHDVYADMVSVIGDPHVEFYDQSPLSEFPSSKHLVVAGALQNVTAQTTVDELSESANVLAKLPAGRSMTVAGETMAWWALVGEGMDLPAGLNLATASEAKIHVMTDEMPAPPPRAWMTRLENSVGSTGEALPYPTQPELLRELREGLVGSPPRLKRGPLQLIVELEWSEALSRRRGSVR